MADTVKRYFKQALRLLMALMFVLHPGVHAASAHPVQDIELNKLYYGIRGHSAPLSPDMMKILATLEPRVRDRQRFLKKAEEKLAGLSEKDLRLIAALCDRIPADGRTPDSDIAFLLATALVILS